jgi:hypothetical protein
MSLFNGILAKLGMSRRPADAVPLTAPRAALQGSSVQCAVSPASFDVIGRLQELAAERRGTLNWRESIIDLLELLDLDSSFKSRKSLAIELGCPSNAMRSPAMMNRWLHKTVLQMLARNGGNIPRELLH